MAAGMDRSIVTAAISTWNVAVTPPTADGIDAWLHTAASNVDIHVICLQEVIDINTPLAYMADAFGGSGGAATRADGLDGALAPEASLWGAHIVDRLPSFTLVARKQMIGICIFVLIAKPLAASCGPVRVAEIGTGPLGVGNKGAVAASLVVGGSTLCFVSAHLASGHKGPEPRNRDVASIQAGLEFPMPTAPTPKLPLTIGAHDFVVWAGDLNYRIAMRDEDVRAYLEQDDLGSLAAADELRSAQASGAALPGYDEAGPLSFAPTYKYDKGTDTYDTSAKRRAPAWCDRVLHRRGEHVEAVAYARHEVRASDHRPVSAVLKLSVAGGGSSGGGSALAGVGAVQPVITIDRGPIASLVRCVRTCCPRLGAVQLLA